MEEAASRRRLAKELLIPFCSTYQLEKKKKQKKTAMGSYDAKGEQSQSGGEVLLYLHEKPGCSTPQPGSSGVDSEGP